MGVVLVKGFNQADFCLGEQVINGLVTNLGLFTGHLECKLQVSQDNLVEDFLLSGFIRAVCILVKQTGFLLPTHFNRFVKFCLYAWCNLTVIHKTTIVSSII